MIQAAINSITDASDTNRYLVRVGPGVYAEEVTMKPWVDIEGSGELVTKITHYYGRASGAPQRRSRSLTVELIPTSWTDWNCAIQNGYSGTAVSPRLTHVTVIAQNSVGVCNLSGSSPVMTDMTVNVSATGDTHVYGIRNVQSSPVMSRIKVTAASSIRSKNYGVENTNSSPTMTDVTATATGGNESTNYAVYNKDSSTPTMANVTATAMGGVDSGNFGVLKQGCRLRW